MLLTTKKGEGWQNKTGTPSHPSAMPNCSGVGGIKTGAGFRALEAQVECLLWRSAAVSKTSRSNVVCKGRVEQSGAAERSGIAAAGFHHSRSAGWVPPAVEVFNRPEYFCPAPQQKILPAFDILKPGAILTPLEVYMVNSPSRPNVRPVDPPSLGASVRPAFSLPHPGSRLRAGRGQFEISNLRFEIPLLPVAVRKDHQGRIKAKTPAIVPHQGKSRQTPYFQTAVRSANHPLDGANRPTNGKNVYQGEILSWGERTQMRASVITNQSPFAPPSPIKAKTPAIKPHQGLSRQPMKKPNTTIPSANGAAPYQPKATPWVCPLGIPALQGRPIPPIKAKNPFNRA